MAFDMYKTHKLADQLESEAYEHCEWAIKSFYDLELEETEYGYEQNVYEVLNEEQITEIEAYVNEWLSPDKYHEPYSISALNRIVDQWHEVRYDEEQESLQDEP
jgi:hypothetical protein